MEIKKRNRTELKSFFVKNAIPTEGEFAELIEGMLNQKDDGIAKLPGSPLSIEASGDAASQKKAINFYKNISDANPDWVLSLNPRADPAKPATAKPGFSIGDNAGNSHFFIDQSTGNVGIGTVTPTGKLDVSGNIFAGNSDIYFTKTDHNHSKIGNTAGYAAIENAKNYDALMILGRAGTSNGRTVKLWDYLQVNGSLDVTKNLKVTGKLEVTGDIQTNVALIGDNPHGANYAAFSHKDQGTATGYALLQHNGGETFLNAPAGRSINIRINNDTKMRIIADGNVGIGREDPKRKLHIGDGGQISLIQANSVATDSQAGIYWHSGNDYAIHRTPGAWTAPTYQQLRVDWPTGIILAPGTGNNAGYAKSYVEITQGKGLRVTQGTVDISGALSAGSLNIGNSFSASIGCADFRIGHSGRKGSLGRALVDGTTVLYINYGPDWSGGVRYFGSISKVSSRKYKEKIKTLTSKEALKAMKGLHPVTFNLKSDQEKKRHLGFIAEETPDVVGTEDRGAVNHDHIVALLTRVVKDQQKAIALLQKDLKSISQKYAI